MSVVTRFAPSPTGFLHIGGARTALFNWLFARHHGGKFHLRIEDTDRQRSTSEAVEAIFDGLRWLELNWDGDAVMQFARAPRHAEVVRAMLAQGNAYPCYGSPQDLEQMREEAKAKGLPLKYNGMWRDRDPADAPPGVAPVIRLRAPQTGETVISDLVQGDVRVGNEQLDDMVLLRADGTPTYMLSVVVDDHDMGVTHVIRGDDHLTNAFRQYQIYLAMGWTVPQFAHIPLIHGPDGAKLSKRHGALGVDAYRDMGYLPEAMRNYLLRLGWGHGDDEIILTEQAIAWFDLGAVGRSPSRFDFAKLSNLNGHYMRLADDRRLAALARPSIEGKLARLLSDAEMDRLLQAMPDLKGRMKTLVELVDNVLFYFRSRPLSLDEKATQVLDQHGRDALEGLMTRLVAVPEWRHDHLEEAARIHAEQHGMKLGKVAQPLRAAITGQAVSPPIFSVMEVLGREESLARIGDIIGTN
jgi:glutamyl-tRNA synthetase